eukprot:scaffold134201_cov28-Tisochrysis_lutea.AAC.5
MKPLAGLGLFCRVAGSGDPPLCSATYAALRSAESEASAADVSGERSPEVASAPASIDLGLGSSAPLRMHAGAVVSMRIPPHVSQR